MTDYYLKYGGETPLSIKDALPHEIILNSLGILGVRKTVYGFRIEQDAPSNISLNDSFNTGLRAIVEKYGISSIRGLTLDSVGFSRDAGAYTPSDSLVHTFQEELEKVLQE